MANLSTFDPNIQRMYNIEESVSIQHELFPRVSVTAGWFHRDYKNLFRRTNTLQTFADYTPFTLFNPIDGTPLAGTRQLSFLGVRFATDRAHPSLKYYSDVPGSR